MIPSRQSAGRHSVVEISVQRPRVESDVSELDEAWAILLAEAEQKARLAGREDVAEYLLLRNSNDLLRKAGVEWLITSFTTLAGEANRIGASLAISNEEGCRFRTGSSTMVGKRLTLANGVRTLFVEGGWPRAPRDGVVRGGGLACGNVRHLGIRDATEEILLVKSHSGAPHWVVLKEHGTRAPFHESSVRRHIAILLDKKR